MKMKKIIAGILALAVVGCTVSAYSGRQAERTVCITAYGEGETSGVYNGFEYTIGSTYDWSIDDYVDYAIITGANDTVVGDVSIPDEINGIKVTEIQNNAFYGNNNITSVIIPDSVTDICSQAFSSCIRYEDSPVLQRQGKHHKSYQKIHHHYLSVHFFRPFHLP